MKWWMLAFALLTVSVEGRAASIVGNGGDVVVCQASQGTQEAQLLDFYEAEKLRDIDLETPAGVEYTDIVEAILNKVATRFPYLAVQMREEYQNFQRHSKFLSSVVLQPIHDAYNAILPEGCHIAQAAMQRPPIFPRDPWFYVSEDLWQKMDEFNRAGLVIHEVLYRIGLRSNVQQSMGIRYLVGLIFSREFQTVSDRDWISGFAHARIRFYETDGLRFPIFEGGGQPCPIVPGAVRCSPSQQITMADLTYDNEDRLQDVVYHHGSVDVYYTNANVQLSVPLSELRFTRFSTHVVMSVKGLASVSSSSPKRETRTEINGQLDLTSARFCGIMLNLITGSDSNAVTPRSFCGQLGQLNL